MWRLFVIWRIRIYGEKSGEEGRIQRRLKTDVRKETQRAGRGAIYVGKMLLLLTAQSCAEVSFTEFNRIYPQVNSHKIKKERIG